MNVLIKKNQLHFDYYNNWLQEEDLIILFKKEVEAKF